MAQKKQNKLEVKNFELIYLQEDLIKLLKEKLKLTVKIDVYQFLDDLEKPIKLFQKVRLEFYKKYGVGDDKKGYKLPDDLKPALRKEIDDLANKKVFIQNGITLEAIKYVESEYPYQWLIKVLKRI